MTPPRGTAPLDEPEQPSVAREVSFSPRTHSHAWQEHSSLQKDCSCHPSAAFLRAAGPIPITSAPHRRGAGPFRPARGAFLSGEGAVRLFGGALLSTKGTFFLTEIRTPCLRMSKFYSNPHPTLRCKIASAGQKASERSLSAPLAGKENAFEPVCPPGGQGSGLRYLTLS